MIILVHFDRAINAAELVETSLNGQRMTIKSVAFDLKFLRHPQGNC